MKVSKFEKLLLGVAVLFWLLFLATDILFVIGLRRAKAERRAWAKLLKDNRQRELIVHYVYDGQ